MGNKANLRMHTARPPSPPLRTQFLNNWTQKDGPILLIQNSTNEVINIKNEWTVNK